MYRCYDRVVKADECDATLANEKGTCTPCNCANK